MISSAQILALCFSFTAMLFCCWIHAGKRRFRNLKLWCDWTKLGGSSLNFHYDNQICSSESSETLDLGSFSTTTVRQVTHDGPSAGSLFLRLGAVVFGVIGTVYHAFNAFLCTGDDGCQGITVTIDLLSIAFIFVQMHFVFCNNKVGKGHKTEKLPSRSP